MTRPGVTTRRGTRLPRALALAAGLVVSLVLVGCGVPLDRHPQIVERVTETSTTSPPTTQTTDAAGASQAVSVYFLDGDRLVAANYPVSDRPDMAQALGFVLAGPATDLQANLTTSIPPGTQLTSATIKDRVARINLTADINDVDGQTEKEAFAQLAFTALGFTDQVDAVRFLIEGRGVDAPTDAGNRRLVTANDFDPPLNPR